MRRRLAELEQINKSAASVPLAQGGGGPHDPGMQARVAKLEAHIEHIQSDVEIKADIRDMKKNAQMDFRLLFGALIAVALGRAGLMAKGFHWY